MPQNLSYPLDVESHDQQGHYIMFMINETTPGKVSTGGGASGGHSILGGQPKIKPRAGFQGKKFIDSNLNAGAGKAHEATFQGAVKGSGLWMKRPGTTRMSKAITLYMPPSVKVSYKSNYKNDEISARAGALGSSIGGIVDAMTDGAGVIDAFKQNLKTIGEGILSIGAEIAIASANLSAPGAVTLAQLSAGAIIGSKMEVMFTDVGRRNFSFAFNFIPKSEKEAKMVYNIVQTFKEHMLPEYMTEFTIPLSGVTGGLVGEVLKLEAGQGRILKIPDTFDIFYFYKNNENPFLNRISTCYLTSLDIDYGGDKYVTYEPTTLGVGHRADIQGPPPQRTNITLTFTEIETITRERAKEGF